MNLRYLFFFSLLIVFSCSSNDSETMDMEMQEMMEMEEMVTTLTGDFMDAAHPTSGTATVNEEQTKLIFTNFKTDAGPNLEIYLATDTGASDYITLGAIQGIDGDYEYNLPDNVDFDTYNHVLIWCVPFSVNFGHAVLE